MTVVARERKSRMWVMRHAEKLDDVDDTWANTAGKKKKSTANMPARVHFIFLKRHRLRMVERPFPQKNDVKNAMFDVDD